MELLPKELTIAILSHLSTQELISFSSLNKSTNFVVYNNFYLLFSILNLSSSNQVGHLINLLQSSNRNLYSIVANNNLVTTSLTLNRSKAVTDEKNVVVFSEITAFDFVLLLNQFRLVELNLRELIFHSLRRRQLALGSSSSTLTRLTIFGKKEDGFNLHTTGCILNQLPQLTHLALRNIKVISSALQGVSPPSFKLKSLALVGSSTTSFSPSQFKWLFKSTAWAESLRSLALEWNDLSPKVLNGIRYVVLRVTSLSLSTKKFGVIESFLLHFPSLLHLRFNSTHLVKAQKLFSNLEHPLSSILDFSTSLDSNSGITCQDLVQILSRSQDRVKFADKLKSIQLSKSDKTTASLLLRDECVKQGIELKLRNTELDGQEEDWIPDLFSAVRKCSGGEQ